MALKDLFKRKKKEPRAPKTSKAEKEKAEIKKVETEKKEKKEAVLPKREKKIEGSKAFRVLKSPHVTEKATDLVGKNQYVFKIWPRANKNEIKKAVQDIYGVDVLNVKIINVPKKKRRLGKIEGFRAGYKKAIIRIKKGQKIEVLPR